MSQDDLDENLYWAIYSDSIEDVEKALTEGANVNSTLFGKGETALHLLIDDKDGGDTEYFNRVVNLLISHGQDVNAKDDEGKTPLHSLFSRYSSSVAVGKMLKKDINAILNLFREKMETLSYHGVDINAQDNEGYTPLNWIVATKPCSNYVEFLQEAVLHGADPTIKNDIFGEDTFDSIRVMTGSQYINPVKESLHQLEDNRQRVISTVMKGFKDSNSTLSMLPTELMGKIASYTQASFWSVPNMKKASDAFLKEQRIKALTTPRKAISDRAVPPEVFAIMASFTKPEDWPMEEESKEKAHLPGLKS
jgi:Ankyrin repeats (3 copies)